MKADLPGVKPEEIELEFEDGILTVFGEHEEKTEEKEERYLRRERRYGSFSRSMALPEGVNADDIEATTPTGSSSSGSRSPDPRRSRRRR